MRPFCARRDRSPPANDIAIESASSVRATVPGVDIVGSFGAAKNTGTEVDRGNGFTNGGTEQRRTNGGVRRVGLRSRPTTWRESTTGTSRGPIQKRLVPVVDFRHWRRCTARVEPVLPWQLFPV